jgi:hypothetical protein
MSVIILMSVAGGCESRKVKERRELAGLVQQLTQFESQVRQMQTQLAAGVRTEDFQAMYMQMSNTLISVERPITQSQRVDRLYDLARGVLGAVQSASDQGVRSLGAAGSDDEYAQATRQSAQLIAGEFQKAANAFLQDYAAAKQEIAQSDQ